MYDLAIIGGGINGCGIARDAAGRGLSVLLLEKGDLASGTSSASTKLVHGGLRYLEHFEFRLVRESLKEREVLWAMAPHIIRPLRFVLPHETGLRPAWLIRLGLFLYDHIGGRKRLPATKTLNLKKDTAGTFLKDQYRWAFEYSDCWVDDARLVVLNAKDAAIRGADIRVGSELLSARRGGDAWLLSARDHLQGKDLEFEARCIVNAAGPWVGEVLNGRIQNNQKASMRLVRGSHIVVPRIFDHDRAYIFQNADSRIIFAIPYEGDFTLIGTTDVDVGDDPQANQISGDEISYLCQAVSEYFARPVRPDDIVWTYSGIRPLFDDGEESAQAATRDYVLETEAAPGQAALLNIYGGKITTYRELAEAALDKLAEPLGGIGADWTYASSLPGGDFGIDEREGLLGKLVSDYEFLDQKLLERLFRNYGRDAWQVLDRVSGRDGLGVHFGASLYECEVDYLVRNEWAVSAADIVWRRSKLGLRLTGDEISALDEWLKNSRPEEAGGKK